MKLQEFAFTTTDIKGKGYIEVNQRIKAFRECDEFVGWSLETELVSLKDNVVLFKAIVKNPEGRIISTGYSYEEKDTSMINSTSFIENAETSAVGRALGNLGIGISISVCSADEVKNAIKKQEKLQSDKKITIKEKYTGKELELGAVIPFNNNQNQSAEYKLCYYKNNGQYFWA